MQQWLIKACLVLLSHDKHIEILMEFSLGLGFPDMAAVFANVQLRFGVFLAAVDDAVNNVNKQTISPPRAHRAPDLVLNTADLTLSCGGRQVKLTPAEAALFSLLSDNKGAAVSYTRMSEAVGSSSSNKVEVHVCALRRKLGQIYSRPLIVTVRGEGYKLG